MSDTFHLCHATGCAIPVEPAMFMCKRHWFMLPIMMRNEIWNNYVPEQEIHKDPTPQYIQAAKDCILFIERKELEILTKVTEEANFASLIENMDKKEEGKE